ncbi:pentatricopeptide repeat-containing protein At5g27110-like [Impatiens glandulifera]|uniref:pentatricopeptide repeat-containing protein At5g27110-like n=1 Tax=Impatiens glandulifera TaxID=253017 RepID=UPI001FB07BDD|nr:pentatricopeptide repeat-containing protein At5g27110-like [Impatiens glandulifera]
MEMTIALHTSLIPTLSIANTNPNRISSFSASPTLKNLFFEQSPPLNFIIRAQHRSHSRVYSPKCVLSGAPQTTYTEKKSQPIRRSDHGKTTLVDAILKQTKISTPPETVDEQFLLPDDIWPQLLQVSVKLQDVLIGKSIHGHFLKSSYLSNVFYCNNLIHMYAGLGRLENAQLIFDDMLNKNTISWTSLINGYCQIKDFTSVNRIAHDMHIDCGNFNERTCSVILKACEFPHMLMSGQQMHCYVIKLGYCENVFVGTSLIGMYSRCGHMEAAEKLFDTLTNKDVRCLNSMISELGNVGYGEKAFRIFADLLNYGVEPNDYTFTNVISSSAGYLISKECKQLHGLAIKHGLMSKTSVGNAIVSMYSKHRAIGDAEKAFHLMKVKDLVSWTAILSAYLNNSLAYKACNLIPSMVQMEENLDSSCLSSMLDVSSECRDLKLGLQIHGFVIKLGALCDIEVETALIDLYAKCGDLVSALLLFNNLPFIATASFNAILAGFTGNGRSFADALFLFNNLRLNGLQPDSITFSRILSLCADEACLDEGTTIHAYSIKTGHVNGISVGNALVTMYAKCGGNKESRKIFDFMEHHDLISWNSLLSSYALHGRSEKVILLFKEMIGQGFVPDAVTVLVVLQACAYSGLCEYGIQLFKEIESKYGVIPRIEHFACLVDIMGRAKLFSQAIEFIRECPFSKSHLLWRTLVHTCKLHRNVIFGKMASKCLLDLAPEDAGSYMLVSNMYATCGMLDEASKVRTMMKDLNISKEAGCSWIEVDNKTHCFKASDRDHPESSEIYLKLDLLTIQMKQMHGDVPIHLIWDRPSMNIRNEVLLHI